MSSFRNLLANVLLVLSAAMGGVGVLSQTVQEDFFFSYTSYWFVSIWTALASISLNKPAVISTL